MPKKMWMIRAGRNAALVQEFEERSYVGVGWTKLGDLSSIKDRAGLEALFQDAYPDESPARFRMSLGQIARFRFDIRKGDYVITYNPEYRYYLVGEILSEYQYAPDSPGDFNHILKVSWHGKIDRDRLSLTTKNTVGAIMTLFLLSDSARDEFLSLLKGDSPAVESSEAETVVSEMDDIKRDVIDRATEFIKDTILKLDWDEMQELVAGILRAIGYKTRVASPGPDRGADIIASPDGLGLEQPRIRVEVKHREGAVGAPLLRSFIGGLRQNDRGLYVATGGFSREARYEAERSTVPVTLVDIDELTDLLTQYYDETDSETRALIPLTKLYWPA
jgi:restriction system protein